MMHAPFAYLGPGSGFAFLGSFLTVLLSLVASFLSLLLWPFRMIWSVVRRGRTMRRAPVRKLIVLDLKGLNPDVAERLMAKGSLPSLARLKDQGSYRRLRVSSYATCPTVLPAPFWKLLKRNAVDSTILRVPGSPAADDFAGRRLFAASELHEISDGFSWFTKKAQSGVFKGGKRYPLVELDGVLLGELGFGDKPILFRVIDAEGDASLEINSESYPLKPHEFTPWIRLKFGAVHGIVRFLLTSVGPDFSLYATAVQIDPENPTQPISQPRYYANYLAKLLGTFSSGEMAEASFALKAGVIDDEDFLAVAKLRLSEQEAIFFSALEHQPSGVLACVLETTERILDDVDRLIGKTLELADRETAVFVLASSGAFFSNRRLDVETPAIEDIAPTALRLFGIQPPEWMEGKSVISVA
ncbi:MAG TPA: hypothetical protein VGL82_13135 [Bryobacteraceae bacterium]|jgi:hypothetical protein